MAASFKDAFCARYDCEPDEFQRKATAQCLYPHAKRFWAALDLVGAKTTYAAAGLIERAGEAQSEDDLRTMIKEYLSEAYPHIGPLAKALQLRVSTNRLLAMYRAVCSAQNAKAGTAAAGSRPGR